MHSHIRNIYVATCFNISILSKGGLEVFCSLDISTVHSLDTALNANIASFNYSTADHAINLYIASSFDNKSCLH